MKVGIYSVYSPDEIYLVNELEVLSQKFSVLFFERDKTYHSNIRVKEKDNIKVYKIDFINSRSREWYKTLAFCLFERYFWNELWYMIKNGKLNRNTFINMWRVSAHSRIDSKKIYDILKNEDMNELLLYSYRMNSGCMTLMRVRNKLEKKYHKNIKLIARAHGIDLYEYRDKDNYLPFHSLYYKSVDKIYCISQDGANYLKSQYHINNVSVSRLGTKDFGIQMWERKSDCIRLLSCSRIDKNKRLSRIIDALANIKNISVKWIHIGDGDIRDLVEKQAEKKLNSNIEFQFLGRLPNNQIMEYYMKHPIDIFINVSYDEGLPVAIMEATSFGIPIIATDVGGVSEIVYDKENGFLLDRDFTNSQLRICLEKYNKMSLSEIIYMRNKSRIIWEKYFNCKNNYELFRETQIKLV